MRQYDLLRKAQGYKNRSFAVADMMRDCLVEDRQTGGGYAAVGTVTLV